MHPLPVQDAVEDEPDDFGDDSSSDVDDFSGDEDEMEMMRKMKM
jgi:hypothetical protein